MTLLLRRLSLFVFLFALALSACVTTEQSDFFPEGDGHPTDPGRGTDAGTPDGSPPPGCGNRKVDPGEQCDDGNGASGDGCSATCAIESVGPNDACDGAPIALALQDGGTLYTASVAASTAGLYHHYASRCGGGSGADAVYRVESPLMGRATVRLTSGFPAIVSVRSDCSDAGTELACKDSGASAKGGEAEVSFPIYADAPVFVFVDGYGGQEGEFSLAIEVQTAFCGNGKAEHPETCDDGNVADGDGCSSTCMLEDTASVSDCPGMGYRLSPGTMSFAGDTSTMTTGGGSASGCATAGGGPNAIYAITPTVTGALALDLLASYPNALLHVRRDCSIGDTQFDCSFAAKALTPLSTTVPVFAERTVYVFVDGSASATAEGPYTFEAKLTAAACGNGVVDGGEECDDGNTTSGDGCGAACTVERQPESYACPGKAIRLEAAAPGPRTAKLRGTTLPLPGELLPKNNTASCGSKAPDVVYQVTSDIDGYLRATVSGGLFNATVSVRAACAATTDIACGRASTGNAPKTVLVPIEKETPCFLVVDGRTEFQSGGFELDLVLDPSVCGNGVVEGGETCDDGAVADGDGCDVTCHLETERARDECATAPAITLEPRAAGSYGATITSGNTNLTKPPTPTHSMSPCSSVWADGWFAVTAPISGVLRATITSATFRSTIGVRTACAPSGTQLTCDGTNAKGGQQITIPVNAGSTYYLGVAGGFVNFDVPEIGLFSVGLDLVPTGCGDGFVNAPEQCDDGNTANGDGCSSTCAVASLPNIDSCPGHAIALTGTGAEVRRAVVTVDTSALSADTASTCGGSGPEGIIAVTSDIDGQLQVTGGAAFSLLLHGRTTCADPVSEIPRSSCSIGRSSFSTSIVKNVPVYLFVDGTDGTSGIAKLQITVAP